MPEPGNRLLVLRSALAYLALLAGLLFFLPGAAVVGACAVILAILLGWQNLRLVAKVIFGLLTLATGFAVVTQPAALQTAAENMTRLTALILTVMLLSTILGASRDLGAISRSLFAGKPLARYYSVAFGTAFLSVPLNFGSVGVVATMVQGELQRTGDSAMTRNASRAALRGFGASPICSPLSISIVLTITLLSGLHSWELIACSLPIAVVYLLSGALFRDPETRDAATTPESETGLLPWLRFAGIIGAICLGTLLLSTVLSLGYSRAVTYSCLAVVVAGVLLQRARGRVIALPSMAPATNELVIVGGSAFLGALISAFALHWLGMDFSLPHWAYPIAALLVPWAFFGGGMLGLNPIVTGTLVGGVLAPIWPAEALLGLGLAMVSGWGIAGGGTPYTANSLLLERITGYSARTAATRWNLRLSLISLVVTGLIAASVTVLRAGL